MGDGSRVFCGLSGGVDSALAAALLVEQGYDVTAVYMRNWSRDLPGFRCPWADDLADAERVAVTLGIDLEVWDCEAEYQTIKFGTFAERALERGADFVATGHYGRIVREGGRTQLLRARDEHKDQTYFLWRVSEEALSRALLPVGEIADKAEVRRMCAERGLGVEAKPDSDGICFVGPVGIRTFLLDELERRAGDVVEWETGRVLGHHDGAFLFTVGQRKGLDLGGGPARYVVSTDVEKNVVYVTADRMSPALFTREIRLEDVRWISGEPLADGRYLVRTRHTGELREADLLGSVLRFDKPVRRVAPGQSAVLYDGVHCLGGGIVQAEEGQPPFRN